MALGLKMRGSERDFSTVPRVGAFISFLLSAGVRWTLDLKRLIEGTTIVLFGEVCWLVLACCFEFEINCVVCSRGGRRSAGHGILPGKVFARAVMRPKITNAA